MPEVIVLSSIVELLEFLDREFPEPVMVSRYDEHTWVVSSEVDAGWDIFPRPDGSVELSRR